MKTIKKLVFLALLTIPATTNASTYTPCIFTDQKIEDLKINVEECRKLLNTSSIICNEVMKSYPRIADEACFRELFHIMANIMIYFADNPIPSEKGLQLSALSIKEIMGLPSQYKPVFNSEDL